MVKVAPCYICLSYITYLSSRYSELYILTIIAKCSNTINYDILQIYQSLVTIHYAAIENRFFANGKNNTKMMDSNRYVST